MSQIILFDLSKNEGKNISPSSDGTVLNGESLKPQLSADGKMALFSSNATNLSEGRSEAIRSTYLYDSSKGKLTLIPKIKNQYPDRVTLDPKISDDGRFILFKSPSTNLKPKLAPTSLSFHLYLYDRLKGRLIRIDSLQPEYNPEKLFVGQAVMTHNAREIIFAAAKKDVSNPKATLTHSNLYVYSRRDNTLKSLTPNKYQDRSHQPRVSWNGRYLVFNNDEGLAAWDRENNQWAEILDETCENPELSPNGEWIAFESEDPKWGAKFNKKNRHVYLIKNPLFED